jgi:hypothetical protein
MRDDIDWIVSIKAIKEQQRKTRCSAHVSTSGPSSAGFDIACRCAMEFAQTGFMTGQVAYREVLSKENNLYPATGRRPYPYTSH